jgi:UDP-3-O-[3-hydroxymyristoyl] N-acetylglucosamine deacetylase
MRFERLQCSIERVCQVSGRGYWTGQPVTVSFLPAPVNHGIVFRRSDLKGQPAVSAVADFRREAALRTRLETHDCSVQMIEHVMAALYALHIDNCSVEVSSAEMPGLDGSSLAYALALEQAGRYEQTEAAQAVTVDTLHRLGDDRQWIMITPSAQPGLTCEYRLDYGPNSPIPSATCRATIAPNTFTTELAAARTFVTAAEAKQLQMSGLARHVTHRDLLVFDDNGPIDNALRFDDECARHKLLDLVGDLALCGRPLNAKVTAFRSGHVLNGRMAAWIREYAQLTESSTEQTPRKVA